MNPKTEVNDLRVAAIIGSVRDGRFGTRIGTWVHDRLTASGIDVDLIDLAESTIPHTMGAHEDFTTLTERIGRSDALIVITPEYNHSYPGPLKTAIDMLGHELRAKPVGFVSYGGLSGGLRAVEALRPVLAELHAVTVRETVSLHNPWSAADTADGYADKPATDALHVMARQLLWWADALRTAKERVPYPA
ncbi:NAD(P)H-dependent oxidoreductase [Nocardia cyriacigeorgica]|uniref:NAD(P)H-dependent oxidoreductase n=1 Tax=Nocardia cyriacigeorgica TaxID=135487 RepID=A0A6P1DD91_9NOCA|nr:NAD(P)H-dependent oxidoreductase [Nocardia cyriacigeorgica]NEW42182.1 NAD(P)H-dependent oxidoreductase [Nocardia cyriacigeorgica]NEW47124.1 NAD(P)H-dependent oxidoreductase [Nocardia cyriacigeorgica]NEW53200.1 NAD(P)H-dependent oxidoreductase [Nocardia cyriacigeorgica]NEW55959.1 NAD(P)H-dependent oxidoreductase [Nocardia cyriacigeorgica]